MPHRHEPARLREEEKKDPINDGQRLLEEQLGVCALVPRRESPQQQFERIQDAVCERAADSPAMTCREIDRAIEQPRRSRQCLRTPDTPKQRECVPLLVREEREIELEIVARPCAVGIDDA
jgi:hypothetical protein